MLQVALPEWAADPAAGLDLAAVQGHPALAGEHVAVAGVGSALHGRAEPALPPHGPPRRGRAARKGTGGPGGATVQKNHPTVGVISNGAIIGIVVTAPGSGYGTSGAQIAVTIPGNGTGATATATAGVPIPNNRRMRVRCNTAVHFYRSGSSPVQENWTGTDITAAINSDVEWSGVFNTWRASFFSSANYLAPDALGGAALTSFNNGDVQLHPAGTGHLRLVTDAEATGAYEMIGRNTPQGAVTAPPGSTFRNLNGGVGSTFYVKQTGTGNTGWAAIG